MQDDFDGCLRFVLTMEGGFVDNPDDHGGATNHGITQVNYDAWRRAQALPVRDVRLIAMDEVAAIYRSNYWDGVHGDYVAMPLCLVLFDTAVNCGVGEACKMLNSALGLGEGKLWSDATSDRYHSLNSAGIANTSARILALRREFYERIAQNPGQAQFLDGWLNRIRSLSNTAGLA